MQSVIPTDSAPADDSGPTRSSSRRSNQSGKDGPRSSARGSSKEKERLGKIHPGGRDHSEADKSSSKSAPSSAGRRSLSRDKGVSGAVKLAFESETAQTRAKSCVERLRTRSQVLVDSWRFCVLTTVLTFYALFGDDFRLLATNKRTDNLFNVLTLFCIFVFSTEIVAASLGKEEYFLGFFFTLDFGSTVTLLFDLTWVTDSIYCNTESEGGAIEATSAIGAGARASRTVRIIRLVRLVKLYKTYKTAIEQKDHSSRRRASTEARRESVPGEVEEEEIPGDVDHDDETTESGERKKANRSPQSETRVGKKLSDMTTRRVILLVLCMLFMMPVFNPSTYGSEDFRSSGYMGIELIYQRWRTWCPVGSTVSPGAMPWCLQETSTPIDNQTAERHRARDWFERYLLTYLYNHHKGDFQWQLYWVGINSTSLVQELGEAGAGDRLGTLAQLNQARWLGTSRVESSLDAWNDRYVNPTWQVVGLTAIPETVRNKLVEPWNEKCKNYYGVAMSSQVEEVASVCSIDEELRCSEVEYYLPLTRTEREERHINMMFAFDTRGTTQLEAGLNMLQTLFICFAVGLGAMTFSSDAKNLLLNPIERMIAKMETIKDNPLEAMKLGDLEYRREEIENAKRREQLAKRTGCWKFLYMYSSKKVKEPMETVILEKTIIKLGGLLALGFGEAGAEIIGSNMKGGASAGVNAMVPGQKVDAIIGFCNIRNFTDATEVLKEKVMLFVNQVGEIVHGCADDYHGAPNKNIGESFLLVWRLSGAAPERQTKLADMAIMSFIRIVAEINKSRVLAVYRGHPGLQQRLPDYRVSLGFGLHCGWAIEGAIGSELKIDASYLSPNVNVASRLEAATSQFGVWILVSHFMINLCSPEMATQCRLIDHVTVKGSKQSVRLYTIDLDCMQLEVVQRTNDLKIKNRFKIRQIREMRKNDKWAEDYHIPEAFDQDDDLLKMRKKYSTEFFQRFSMAYRNYEAGEWMVARDMLFTCRYKPFVLSDLADKSGMDICTPEDGPTVALLCFMKQTNYYPPEDWPGHRELTEK